jgi:CBS domain-containing protein
MPIRDVMQPGVEVIHPGDCLKDAATKMAERDIGFLPVCEGDSIVGALTDRDITLRATARGLDPNSTLVREVMTEQVTYCFEDEDIDRAGQLMKEARLRRVIVVDRDKRLVGVVSLGDLASRQQSQSSEVLESVSQAPPNK